LGFVAQSVRAPL